MCDVDRTLGEICRSFSHLKLFAFFTQRAIEVKPYTRMLSQSGPHSFAIFWQSYVIMAHEAAHALPKISTLWEDFHFEAQLETSQQINHIVLEGNRKLQAALDSNFENESDETDDMRLLLDSLDHDKGSISGTFLEKRWGRIIC